MNFKKVLGLALMSALLVGLTGCGNKGTDPELLKASKENVYKYEEIQLFDAPLQDDSNKGDNYSINSIGVAGDKLVVLAHRNYWENNTETGEYKWGNSIEIVTANMDGTGKESAVIWEQNSDSQLQDAAENTANSYLNNTAMADNYVYGIIQSEDYETLDEFGRPLMTADLLCWNTSGEEVFRVSVMPEKLEEDEWFYVEHLLPLSGDRVLVGAMQTYSVYDNTGKKIQEIKSDNENGYSAGVLTDKNDNLILLEWNADWTKQSFIPYNLTTGQKGEAYETSFATSHYQIKSSKNYDMIMTDNSGVYKYNIGETEPTMIMSYINSDLNTTTLNNIVEISDTEFLASYYDHSGHGQKISKFTHVPASEIPDKEVLEVAGFGIPYDVRTKVVEYNKTNEKYRIVTKDYSRFATNDDYMAGYTKLNADILAGDMPDVLVMYSGTEIPVDSYIAKGLFADLYEFIDNDPEINREDYFENVFNAFSVDGKLYRLVPSFNVQTVAGKTENVGSEPGWTMQEMKEALAKMPEGATAFGEDATREQLMWSISTMAIPDYIDADTGVCSFDSQGFKDLLTFLKELPEKVDESKYDEPDYWARYETQYIENRTMLMQIHISELTQLIYNFGQMGSPDVTFVGFPSEKGMGAVLSSSQEYAISAKSPNKEGAWEFLRYYLTDEYQKSIYEMPINKDIWMEKGMQATERPYYEDENGEIIYNDYTYWIGEQEVVIDPLTKEQVENIYNYVSSINSIYSYDQDLIEIIKEEAEYYFKGDKTVDEVAAIIQSRIQLYIDEQR